MYAYAVMWLDVVTGIVSRWTAGSAATEDAAG